MEQGKYVPPVEHWKDFEYDLYHHKKSHNFVPRKGDNKRRNKRGGKNKPKGNNNGNQNANKASGENKPGNNKNERKSWNDVPG